MITPTTSGERVPQALKEPARPGTPHHRRILDVCRVLATARDALRALSWARFKARARAQRPSGMTSAPAWDISPDCRPAGGEAFSMSNALFSSNTYESSSRYNN